MRTALTRPTSSLACVALGAGDWEGENSKQMTDKSLRAEFGLWPMACVAVALISTYVFLQDLIKPDWPAWVLTPLLVIGFRGALNVTPEDSFLKGALRLFALLSVLFMTVYGLLDAIFSSDGPVWAIAPIIVLGIWFGLSTVADIEGD